MDPSHTALDPVSAQQLVARYVAIIEQHSTAGSFPAPSTTLPASKDVLKGAVRTTLMALAHTHQLTGELSTFLEEAFVSLSNFVDDEMAHLAAEHRTASAALEHGPRPPGERVQSADWEVVARSSRLAGEIARASAQEALALRREFRDMLAAL